MKVKTIKNYYELIYHMYPFVSEKDIRIILNYGWRMIYLHSSFGGDIQIVDQKNGFWCYFGWLKKNPIKWFRYYIKKLALKIRVLYGKRKVKWDGYYYFGLKRSQYEKYLSQTHKGRGRPKKWFDFGNVKLYKIKDECLINENAAVAIFQVPYIDLCGLHIWKENYKTNIAELILTREPLKFKDVLVTNNNYLK